MSDNFDELIPWLERINQQLNDSQKRTLNRRLSTKLRAQMKRRIASQSDPDGRRFTPRKRNQVGSIRSGALFKRLPKMIKTAYSSRHAEVGFAGRTAEVMAVHQYGKTIKPSPNAKATRYPIRVTVGFSEEDKQLIINEIKDFLLNE